MKHKLWLIPVLALGSTPGAFAQPADKRATAIEEVIVTARKIEESLQDTPVSVAAFSSEDLEQIGASQAGDIASFTPGLRMQKQSGSNDNYAMAIRGVSSGETALAIDPTVGVYMDGVYIARSTGLAFDIVDLQRIEVLRGPQGTLFGRNTIGGAINIITKKPRGEFHFKQLISAGNRDYNKYQASIDTPAFGNFAAKFSFMKQAEDGQLKNQYSGERLADKLAEAQRLAINWTPSESLEVDLIYDQSFRDSNSLHSHLSAIKDIYSDPSSLFYGGAYYDAAEAASGPDRRSQVPLLNTDTHESNSDIRGGSLTVEWEISEALTAKSISSYREWRSKARGTDFGSFPVQTTGDVIDLRSGSPSPVAAGTFVSLFSATRENTHHQVTQEFQLIGSAMEDRLQYQTGLYLFEEKASELNPQQFVLPTDFIVFAATGAPPLVPSRSATWLASPFAYTTDNSSWALYGQATYNFVNDLDVTLGLRYTVDEKAGTLTNNLENGAETVAADDDWANLNPSLTVDYRWSEQVSTYFRAATGYRSGGYNVRALTSTAYRTPFNEENIVSYELGVKSDLLDRSLRLNASIFRLLYDDRQIAQFEAGSGGASSNIVNAGKSETNGFEIEALWIPVPGLRITAVYGYLDVEYVEFVSSPVDRVTGFATATENRDIADEANTNLYAPTHSSALAVEYSFAPWSFGQLTLRVDSTFSDSISFHPILNFYDETEAVSLLNARATLADIPAGKDGTLKLSAWGKNIENKEYRTFGIDFGVLGLAINNYGPLNAWGIDLVYEYGGS